VRQKVEPRVYACGDNLNFDLVPETNRSWKCRWQVGGRPFKRGLGAARLLTPMDANSARTLLRTLAETFTVVANDGYDLASGIILFDIPTTLMPQNLAREDAEQALKPLRRSFRTFAFGSPKLIIYGRC